MGIKIEKVVVKNLGPIESFSEDFGLFNLIFSKNECGKTFLTEFIIQSLFKNIKRWQFREKGTGKVLVSGLNGDSLVEFSPGSAKKLEDYWESDEKGLPPSMVNLLVSKGAEPEIEDSKEGIGKSLIKEIFSGLSLLDKIDRDSNISRTVKAARFEDGKIFIGNTGEGKTFHQLQEEINRIDKLFSEIESKYTKGIIESLGIEEKRLEEYVEKLYKAKCYEAYLVSEKIKNLNEKLQQNNEEELNRISTSFGIYEKSKSEYARKLEQYEELQKKCRHYEWLQRALPAYEKLSSTFVKKPKLFIAVLSGLLAAAAVLFSIFNISFGAIASLIAAAGLIVFYIIKLSSSVKNFGLNEELNNIRREFKNKTGSELSDITELSLEIDSQKESYDMAKLLAKQLDELGNQNDSLVFSIQQAFYDLEHRQIPEAEWHSVLKAKKIESAGFKIEIESLQKKLIDFAVRVTEYLTESPGISFSYDEYEKFQSELSEIHNRIKEKNDEIEKLKYSVCIETNDDTSIGWGNLLEHLREKRSEKQNELNFYQSKISAGIIVHELITELRKDEDKKVMEGLQSEVVLKSLKDLTKNYCKLYLDGERLIISDDYRDFCLKDLSTGAREQIMLGLRIGFSSKILNQDSLFLILDDAFQHSDWDRRKILVSKLADIAQRSWQIIYLTMDNNIRDLFEKAGLKFKKGEYKYIELKS